MSTDGSSQGTPTALEEWVVVSMETLQRSLARTRLLLAAVTLLLVGWIVVPPLARAVRARSGIQGGPVVQEIRARQFVLTDAAGHVRGTWNVDPSGVTRLMLRDASGVPRLRISVLEAGSPGMAFTDEQGHSRVVLGLLPDRSSSLVLADPQGETRVVLGLQPDNGATLVFADPSGKTRAGIGVDSDGQPTFLMDQAQTDTAGNR